MFTLLVSQLYELRKLLLHLPLNFEKHILAFLTKLSWINGITLQLNRKQISIRKTKQKISVP